MGLLSSKQEKAILMIGLDAAGKTYISYKFAKPNPSPVPFHPYWGSENFSYKNTNFVVIDTGGQEKYLRRMLSVFVNQKPIDALIYVIDGADSERFTEASHDLHFVLQCITQLQQVPLLIFWNKIDLPKCLQGCNVEIMDCLKIDLLNMPFRVQACSAVTGEGLYEGFEWIVTQVHQQQEEQKKDT